MSRKRGHPYGRVHKEVRRRFARRMAAGEVFFCWRPSCPTPKDPVDASSWDLGHVDRELHHRFGSRWPEHPKCNRATMSHVKAKLAASAGDRQPVTASDRPPKKERFGGLPDPEPGNTADRWSRHWAGNEFNPRCRDCRERGSACDVAVRFAEEAAT